ncbi:hypothetical protein EON67_09725 [archaeon]|nr:MAG: hypothetical protein EON67_09725 [archaeon]
MVAALAVGEEHGLRHNTVESALPGDALSTLRMDAMKKLLGHVVFCDWPHLREALVEGVSDDAYTCEYKGDAEVPAAEVARAELTSGHVWASGDQPMWRVRMNGASPPV